MSEKYINKFHKLKFDTDVKKDMEMDIPPLSKDLDHEKINDDFSNQVQYEYEGLKEEKDKI